MWDSLIDNPADWTGEQAARSLSHYMRFERWAWDQLEAARSGHLAAEEVRERLSRHEFSVQLIAGVQKHHPAIYHRIMGLPSGSPSNSYQGRFVSAWESRAAIPAKHPGLMRVDAWCKVHRGSYGSSQLRTPA